MIARDALTLSNISQPDGTEAKRRSETSSRSSLDPPEAYELKVLFEYSRLPICSAPEPYKLLLKKAKVTGAHHDPHTHSAIKATANSIKLDKLAGQVCSGRNWGRNTRPRNRAARNRSALQLSRSHASQHRVGNIPSLQGALLLHPGSDQHTYAPVRTRRLSCGRAGRPSRKKAPSTADCDQSSTLQRCQDPWEILRRPWWQPRRLRSPVVPA